MTDDFFYGININGMINIYIYVLLLAIAVLLALPVTVCPPLSLSRSFRQPPIFFLLDGCFVYARSIDAVVPLYSLGVFYQAILSVSMTSSFGLYSTYPHANSKYRHYV